MIHISIKPAIIKDIPVIVSIHKDCVAEINSKFYPDQVIKEWLGQISKSNVLKQFKDSSWIVARLENQIVGFAQYSIKTGEIFQINTNSKFLRQGIGEELYQFILKDFQKHHSKKISLNSTLNAVPFYGKLGFKSLGKIRYKLNKQVMEMEKMEIQLLAS